MQLYLDQSIMQPVGVKVTIRGGGELLLLTDDLTKGDPDIYINEVVVAPACWSNAKGNLIGGEKGLSGHIVFSRR
jgi:hypothetical protein